MDHLIHQKAQGLEHGVPKLNTEFNLQMPALFTRPFTGPVFGIKLGMKIFAPALARAVEKARPNPLLPPITIAAFPFKEKKSMENSSFVIKVNSFEALEIF